MEGGFCDMEEAWNLARCLLFSCKCFLRIVSTKTLNFKKVKWAANKYFLNYNLNYIVKIKKRKFNMAVTFKT